MNIILMFIKGFLKLVTITALAVAGLVIVLTTLFPPEGGKK